MWDELDEKWNIQTEESYIIIHPTVGNKEPTDGDGTWNEGTYVDSS